MGLTVSVAFTVALAALGWWESAAVSLVATGLFALSAVAMYRRRTADGRRIAIVGLLVVVLGVSWWTGGVESPAILWCLLVPTVVSGVDPRPVRMATAVVGLVLAGMGCMHALGLVPPSQITPEWQGPFLVGTLVGLVSFWGRVQADRMQIRSQLEAEREAALADFERARARADAASAAKSDFIAHMSHEIRTPLNGIRGLTALLAAAELPEVARQRVTSLDSAGAALAAIIEDILDFSRIESGTMTLASEPFDPEALTRGILAMFEAQARDLSLEVVRHPGVPAWVSGDLPRVRQVLTNLIGNAVKFTPTGSVTVHIRWEAGVLSYAVADTGIGIAEADRGRLFHPFTQLDPTSTRRHGGTGLGLVISRRLANLLGGDVQVESELGRGSTFTFTLSARSADAPAPVAETIAPLQPRLTEWSPHVLVAEDNAINRMVVVAMLEQMGCRVDEVVNGAEAVAAAQDRAYDLILMDCMMPELDGTTAARRIRVSERGRHVPIVALTANAQSEQRSEALAAGMDAFLTKPIEAVALRRVVDELRPDA